MADHAEAIYRALERGGEPERIATAGLLWQHPNGVWCAVWPAPKAPYLDPVEGSRYGGGFLR